MDCDTPEFQSCGEVLGHAYKKNITKWVLQTIKKQIRFWINSYNFNKVTEIKEQKVFQNHQELNYVLITLDSCRYDSLLKAEIDMNIII